MRNILLNLLGWPRGSMYPASPHTYLFQQSSCTNSVPPPILDTQIDPKLIPSTLTCSEA